MLEHSAMYLNVTPPYEDDASFFPDFYTRVGSCELQEPVWAKMNALTGIKQKRKKSDNKPQTQINKCNNEKRRREQENIYIEELAELISANFADMSSLSVKPDKCAILQETVNQIRRIKQQDNNQQIADPVQQGEVSSSRPTILSNEVYGPLLLEALEGFLFVINSEGKVEHVTDNVINYIKHAKDEIIGKSIYNFMHPGDHTKFHSNLLPMTIEWDQSASTRSKSIDVRLLVKTNDDLDETVEEKTQRVPCYELMHISSTQLRDHLSVSEDDGSDSGPCLLCVASRISHREKASCFFEQFTTKLDTNGKIICVDTSGVSEGVSQVLRKDFKGRLLRDLVPAQDCHKVIAHLKETLSAGTSISSVYRIQVAPDKLVPVQTKSKFFKTNPHANSEVTDFIMATHSIIGDNDSLDPGGGIGGPLLTSIVNGASRNGPSNNSDSAPPPGGIIPPPVSTAGAFTSEFLESDFSTLDFPSTTWELEPSWPDATRPNSRQSTPVSTPAPRPPSNPSYSNAPTVAQSPIAHYHAQPSPVSQQQSNQNSNSFMPFGIMEDYQEPVFNVDDQKDSKVNVMEEAPSHAEPQRLRSLLTNPPTSNNASSSSSSGSHQDENRDRILKELLNQQDDEQSGRMGDGRNNNARVMMRPMPEPPKNAASSSTGNDMLRKLLNDKNDEDDIETKAGMKKGSELLQQLLKKDSDDDDERKNENGPHEDVLLKTLGFPSGSPSGDRSGNKRSMDNKDDRGSKRINNGSQNSSGSSEKSEIYQKNKMLASLLENPTPTPPSIPPIPASVISATPQEKLPRVITDPAKLIPVTMNQGNMRPTGRARQQPVTFSRPISGAANPPNFIDHIWIENNNDPVLSAILDDFIDFVPDRNILLSESGQEGQPTNSFQLSESAAINNIQKILMEVEDSVPSPNVSLPARPPAYSTNNNLGYPPPPNYHQVKYPRPMGIRAGVPQYTNPQQQLHLEQQRKLQHREAEEQKRRLLQQQEQQQLVILSNNASASINPTQTFDSLLNNTVAPNVTLQRSSSIPESQLSPGYNNQLQGTNSLSQTNQRGSNRQQQQQPYSPHSQQLPSPLGNFQTQTTAAAGNYSQQQQRLSPQSQYNSQLSPRQTYTTQGNNGTGAGSNNWAQQQQQRLTVQNPMLNAQLTKPSSAQQQRALNSPGGVQGNTRHSPFGGDQFAPPSSPTQAFNQNQYLQRLQRANSVPTTSSQMTGGLGSPRSYSGQAPPPHYPPPSHLQSIPQNPMLYGGQTQQQQQQQDSPYNCYEQQQPPNLGYERRGGAQAQHLQPGVAGSNPTSEFVRQELRAVVGARTAQQQPAVGGQRAGPTPAQQLQQQLNQSGTVDLESLGLSFEMASGASESPKLWAAMGSELGSMSPQPQAISRTTMEEGRQGDHAKTSLLQQLLSDQSK